MEALASQIREIAKRLLEEGKVDCVIGYQKGTVPMRERPYFAYSPAEAENLTWSGFCTSNLANFVVGRTDRFAICAQGCVSRNLVGLIQENQITREQVYVLGINSPGMVDRRRVAEHFEGKLIVEVTEEGQELLVKGRGWQEKVERKKFLRDNCYTCTHRNPVIVDEWIGEKGPEEGGGDIDHIAAPWEKLEAPERWRSFAEEVLVDCIRCYACRDACPLCYCHVCFVDESQPQWCGKTQDEADVATFHILRAFHCAGRCTNCGACESACPQGIKMRRLTSKIEKDIREMYEYEPGLLVDATPPMSLFRPNDPQDFLTEG